MKKTNLCLSLACALLLTACKTDGSTLATPKLKVNENSTGLVWDPIEGAISYEICVDEYVITTEDTGYDFSTSIGEHRVSITAVNEKEKHSNPAKFDYTTVAAVFDDIHSDGEYITWSGNCYAMEYAVDDGEFVRTTEDRITITDSGIYTVRTSDGLDEQTKTFYTGQITKTILGSSLGSAPAIIEDGSASSDNYLNEQYVKTKYDGNWVPAGSTISLDNDNLAYTTGKGVVMQLWHHGLYFMFEKEISIKNAFKTFTFKTKANSDGLNYVLSFQIKHNLIVGGVNLNGVYLKYTVGSVPLEWTSYTVRMDDAGWKINFNGQDYPFSQVAGMIKQAGFVVENPGDLFPFFDSFQFRIRANYNDQGYKAYAYFDDVALLPEEVEQTTIEKITPKLILASSYAFESDAASGNLRIDSENSGVLAVNYNNRLTELDVSLVKTAVNKMRVVSTAAGMDFDAILVSDDGGNTMSVESVTGSIATLIANARLESISLMDDFESYDETGVGFDQSHQDGEYSGLRAAYFADFYNQDSDRTVSPVGGQNWRLMGTKDYNDLSTDVAHTGDKSFALKSNTNTMRFMTWDLYVGATKGFKGKYFSFWIKGGNVADMTIAVGVYSTSKVIPSNQQDANFRKTLETTIKKDSDWTEYKIELDTTKTYYGFSITTKNGGNKQYIYVDDVYIYNDMSPWGN